jgi:hypothetical protein
VSRRLLDLAHARAGDKGNLVTVVLIPYDPADYPLLCARVSPDRVRRQLGGRALGGVVRHEMPNIPALLFVCERAAGDTVTVSTSLDAHAKSVSSLLLGLPI